MPTDCRPAAGSVDNKAVFANPLAIARGIESGNSVTRIHFAIPPGDSVSFAWRDAQGQWVHLPVNNVNGSGNVDVSHLPSGTHAYELVSVSGGSHYAHATGTFSLNHAGETRTTPVAAITVPVYATPSGQIRWSAPFNAIAGAHCFWKNAGTGNPWLGSQQLPVRREGSEFVVDAGFAPPGSYDIGILYTDYSPASGNPIWVAATTGTFTVSQTTVAQTTYTYETRTIQHPAINLPVIASTQLYVVDGQKYIGWNQAGATSFTFEWAEVNAFDTNGNSAIQTAVPEYFGSPYNAWGVYTWNPSSGSYYFRVTGYNGSNKTGQFVGKFYSDGRIDNITPPYTPAWTETTTVQVPHTTYVTQTSYGYAWTPYAPTSYTETVPGTLVDPTLTDNTPPATPVGRNYSLTGTANRYFYRGANAGAVILESRANFTDGVIYTTGDHIICIRDTIAGGAPSAVRIASPAPDSRIFFRKSGGRFSSISAKFSVECSVPPSSLHKK